MRALLFSHRQLKGIDFGAKRGKSAVTIYYAQPVEFTATGCY